MYQHFRSKSEICVEYLRRMEANMIGELEPRVVRLSGGKAAILEIFEFVQEFFEKDGFRGCWCQNTISEIPMGETTIMAEIREQEDRFQAFIRRVGPASLEESDVRRLYLLYEVSLNESQLYMEDWPIKEAKGVAQEILKNHN